MIETYVTEGCEPGTKTTSSLWGIWNPARLNMSLTIPPFIHISNGEFECKLRKWILVIFQINCNDFIINNITDVWHE